MFRQWKGNIPHSFPRRAERKGKDERQVKDDPMNRRDDPGNRGGAGEFGGKYLTEKITGVYLLVSVLWLFIGTSLAEQSWEVVLEDSVYHAIIGVLLYFLLRRGTRALRAKEAALR